jgi:pimeloyl-ACP methyl ester carboxylesterase
MKFIETTDKTTGNTIKLAYYDYGTGKPVILIHGWPLSKEMWEYQVDDLINAGLRVIAYDRRGFGQSDRPWHGYDYDTLTDDLRAIIEQLDLNDVTLVGFSMGGGEVARYFTRYSGERVSKAVLISSVVPYVLQTDDNPDGVPTDAIDGMIRGVKDDRIGFLDNFGKEFFGINFLKHPVSNASLEYYRDIAASASPRATLECIKSFSYTDFRTDAPAINVPTLIIHGDADKIVPLATSSEQSVKLISNNQYIIYEGAPHGLFFTDKNRLSHHLASFINTGTPAVFEPTYGNSGAVILPSNDEGLVTRS